MYETLIKLLNSGKVYVNYLFNTELRFREFLRPFCKQNREGLAFS
jgi:hypothetical protein